MLLNPDNSSADPHRDCRVVRAGCNVEDARAAAIMIHGRGANAESILDLVPHLDVDDVAYAAPQALLNTWYPNSFLAPLRTNQPYLTSALSLIRRIHNTLLRDGIPDDHIFIIGFSQGACLGLEYVARQGKPLGGAVALSGALIGLRDRPGETPLDKEFDYSGDLDNTPVFIGCSDIDPHVPVQRINQSEEAFNRLEANVEVRIYPGMGHTVNRDELAILRSMLSE